MNLDADKLLEDMHKSMEAMGRSLLIGEETPGMQYNTTGEIFGEHTVVHDGRWTATNCPKERAVVKSASVVELVGAESPKKGAAPKNQDRKQEPRWHTKHRRQRSRQPNWL